jgi:hypothetical protein
MNLFRSKPTLFALALAMLASAGAAAAADDDLDLDIDEAGKKAKAGGVLQFDLREPMLTGSTGRWPGPAPNCLPKAALRLQVEDIRAS